MIICVYSEEPNFPPTNQHPDASRYFLLGRYIDATGAAPTAAEVEVFLDLDAGALDRRAAREIDGMDRLQFEHLFKLENRVRALEGLQAVTVAQYRNALIQAWKDLHS